MLTTILESVLWEPDVPSNHAGQWLWPLRTILGPVMEAKDHELLAKLFSPTKAAPLWLGTMIGGGYPVLLRTIDYSNWFAGKTLDPAARTGIAQSFLALHSPGPYMQNGAISRSDVWRLRRDCQHVYDKYEEDYTREPMCGWRPFGTMPLEDVEIELHNHLHCSHEWVYKHWIWLHNSATDAGRSPAGRSRLMVERPRQTDKTEEPALWHGNQYRSRRNVKAIRSISRYHAKWVFKWCGNQVEKGFTGHVIPSCHYSRVPPRSKDSRTRRVDMARILRLGFGCRPGRCLGNRVGCRRRRLNQLSCRSFVRKGDADEVPPWASMESRFLRLAQSDSQSAPRLARLASGNAARQALST